MHWTAGFRVCYISDITGPPPVMSIVSCTIAAMSYREIKSDASGALTLLVGGAVILLLTWLGMHGDRFRIWRGGPELSRATHPVLFWSCQITFILVGVSCLVLGVCLFRALVRRDREREKDLEQQAVDSFRREHESARRRGSADDKHPGD